ncbi:hypothetical protein H7J87_12215 [Mycolicibacterium wolinskyi]|uniref:Uncharacterized protein n=1 Tax=Mycolicibacterium wolinskyi TaxID=59750 RepID=A0A1X2FJB5_9MYCO|nr:MULTISPECIES: hypothetical protein [Mycolicibacterium]MCV7286094.1 hypothetical protein [Mycolicibacterium wolinskyi]MCV7296290.1 hypothetical protein [Mycolicibacterium goodii]ORX18516.1 hypothetical protein AWC31_14545 [Mycolicibacterium wolinskyi]
MHPGTPSSVPAPLLVYAVAKRTDATLQPLPGSTVTLLRRAAESELAESDDEDAVLVEQRILPWGPASDVDERRTAMYEYTVGYSHGEQLATWGFAISTDRSAIENDLASVQDAIDESNAHEQFDVLMRERPVLPWYIARPRAAKLL